VSGARGIAWMIGGTAGEGLESGGEAFARALAAAGYRPTTQRDFPSRIRGGDTTATVRLTEDGHLCPPSAIDLALAFNATVLPRMDARLRGGSLLLVDEGVEGFVATSGAEVAAFPFSRLAQEAGMPRAKNMVALGASAALLGIPVGVLDAAVAQQFGRKGDEVVARNVAALHAGDAHARAVFGEAPRFRAPAPQDRPAMWLSGNEAASLGALAAGCRFAAAYPITPASDVLEFLTPRLAEVGGVALQMEDEVAALNAVIGAGFAGARALTATSGPGLSLMTEAVGLASSTETPCVILDCQRPGPSTGMPTKHGQEDLWHLVHGGHGEGVRVVLAPTDVRDAFHATAEAFRLSQRFRCPAFVALDSQMSLFKQAVEPVDLEAEAARQGARGPNGSADGADAWDGTVHPYGDAGDAPRRAALPGEAGGIHYANSTEHAPSGFTTEDPKVRVAMVDRRLARMRQIVAEAQAPVVVEGEGDPDVVLLSWGSSVGACREAARRLRDSGRRPRVVAVRLLWPFPREDVRAAVGDEAPVLVVEANAFAQMARLLRSELPVHERVREVLRYDGTPVRSDDVLRAAEAPA